jgi:predicted transcriptional regulator
MTGKTRGYAFDVDAWIQFHLLRLASFHPETTKADIAVLAEIIQRYWGKYGNGWATHEHLGAAAGISKSSVIRSKRNLELLGFITVVQAGRRGSATVYKPNFALVPQKGVTDDTEIKGSIDDTETIDMGVSNDTITPEYGVTDDTPSYLHDRPTRAGSLIDRNEFAAPVAPPLAGLAAAKAEPAKDGGFEELWKAYRCPKGKAEARTAYNKLAPDADLHAAIVAAARQWLSSWASQDKADAARFTLAKWIEREEYECEPPTGYKPKDKKPKAEQPAQLKLADDLQEKAAPDFTIYPNRFLPAIIDHVDVDTHEDGAIIMTVWFRTPDGINVDHMVIIESPEQQERARGKDELRLLLSAVGLEDINDSSELVGLRAEIEVTHNNQFVSCSKPWVPAPRYPRNVPKFADVVKNTPMLGWALKIGTSVDDDEDEQQEAA